MEKLIIDLGSGDCYVFDLDHLEKLTIGKIKKDGETDSTPVLNTFCTDGHRLSLTMSADELVLTFANREQED